MTPERVLVIGGGGFVGQAIMRALAATPDLQPIAAGRRQVPGLAWRQADAADRGSLAAAAGDAWAIVNAAGGSPRAMPRIAASIRAVAGGRPVVHLSSMAVYGAATGWVAEDAPLADAGSPYAAAKIACETILGAPAMPGGPVTLLRPGIVYGPGDQQWTGRLCRLLLAGRLGDLGAAGDGFCNLIHVRDVAQAVLACLRAPPGGAINLASLAPPRWNDVLAGLAAAIGAVPLRRIGTHRLRLEARGLAVPLQIAKLAAARLGLPAGRLPEPIPPSLLAQFGSHLRLNGTRAAALGLTRTDDTQGLAEAAWFLARPA